MSKGKSITLLSIIGVLLAALIALTFVQFPVGPVKNYASALGAIELDSVFDCVDNLIDIFYFFLIIFRKF